ncbi:DUF6404 family protein [Cardiobacterium hominis]|uniref:DUF6404 family protein n=1 Tax=Cardiobacterium hominis TaxID=2718 RepID=UPI0036F27F94
MDIPKGYRKHPWFYKWLWEKGIALPPVLLAGFFTNMIILGLISGFFFNFSNIIFDKAQ